MGDNSLFVWTVIQEFCWEEANQPWTETQVWNMRSLSEAAAHHSFPRLHPNYGAGTILLIWGVLYNLGLIVPAGPFFKGMSRAIRTKRSLERRTERGKARRERSCPQGRHAFQPLARAGTVGYHFSLGSSKLPSTVCWLKQMRVTQSSRMKYIRMRVAIRELSGSQLRTPTQMRWAAFSEMHPHTLIPWVPESINPTVVSPILCWTALYLYEL